MLITRLSNGGDGKLNERQKRFADEYIISGNATQSAINAGYSKKTGYSQGQRMLKNVEVSKYIKERTQALFEERSMSVAEALAITASIARGEVQTGYSKTTNKLTGDVEKEVMFDYTPSIEERQRSLDHILKVNGAFIDKKEIELQGTVVFANEDAIPD